VLKIRRNGGYRPEDSVRGTVLLLDSQRARLEWAELFRANGLLVYEAARPEDAFDQVDRVGPDVVVGLLDAGIGVSVIRELRARVDYATSIITISDVDHCELARDAGSDAFLLKSVPPTEVLYEVRRALILRRSGRRLPWRAGTS
jgi:DNA-binding response OmpR family regulator